MNPIGGIEGSFHIHPVEAFQKNGQGSASQFPEITDEAAGKRIGQSGSFFLPERGIR